MLCNIREKKNITHLLFLSWYHVYLVSASQCSSRQLSQCSLLITRWKYKCVLKPTVPSVQFMISFEHSVSATAAAPCPPQSVRDSQGGWLHKQCKNRFFILYCFGWLNSNGAGHIHFYCYSWFIVQRLVKVTCSLWSMGSHYWVVFLSVAQDTHFFGQYMFL